MPGVGVDLVDLARIAASIAQAPDRLARRLCSDAERAWIAEGDAVERLAACFGLKEAWIKAVGARPASFRWTDCAYAPDVESIAGLPAGWTRVGESVLAIVGTARVAAAGSAPIDAPADGLTERERAYCNGLAPRIAGRVAAKAALAVLHGDAAVEVLPGEHPPDEPGPCRGSHPPRVVVDGVDSPTQVSISHGPHLAVAVAWLL